MKFQDGRCAVVLFGLFLTVLDQMVMVPIAPFISEDLGGAENYTWTFTAYMFATSLFLLAIGRISGLIGTKRMYQCAMLIFGVGSLLCAASRSMAVLVTGRFIQGIAAGSVMPLSVGILIKRLPVYKLPRMMGTFTMIYGSATILGPISGYILALHSWRSIFLFNIAFAIVTIILLEILFHDPPDFQKMDHFDLRGVSLLTLGLLALLMGLSLSRINITLSGLGLACLMVFPVLLFAFVRNESTAKNPIIPVDYLRSERIMRCFVMNFILGYLLYTLVVFIHLAFLGYWSLVGISRLYPIYPIMVAIIVGSHSASRYLVFRRPKGTLGLTFGLCILGILLFFLHYRLRVLMGMLGGLFVTGLGIGFLLPLLIIYQQENIRPKEISHMVFLVQCFRILGGIVGTSLTAWLLVGAVFQSMDVDPGYIDELFVIIGSSDILRSGIEEALGTFFRIYLGTIFLLATIGTLLGSRYVPGRYSFAQNRKIAELE